MKQFELRYLSRLCVMPLTILPFDGTTSEQRELVAIQTLLEIFAQNDFRSCIAKHAADCSSINVKDPTYLKIAALDPTPMYRGRIGQTLGPNASS